MNPKGIWTLSLILGIILLIVVVLMIGNIAGFRRDILFSLVILLNSLIYLTGLSDIKKGLKRGVAHTFVGGMFSSIIALYVILKKLIGLLYPLIYQTPIEGLKMIDTVFIVLGIVGSYSMIISYRYLKKGGND